MNFGVCHPSDRVLGLILFHGSLRLMPVEFPALATMGPGVLFLPAATFSVFRQLVVDPLPHTSPLN